MKKISFVTFPEKKPKGFGDETGLFFALPPPLRQIGACQQGRAQKQASHSPFPGGGEEMQEAKARSHSSPVSQRRKEGRGRNGRCFRRRGKGAKRNKRRRSIKDLFSPLFSSNALITATAAAGIEGGSHEDEDWLIPILRRREIFVYLFPRNSTGTFSFARC